MIYASSLTQCKMKWVGNDYVGVARNMHVGYNTVLVFSMGFEVSSRV